MTPLAKTLVRSAPWKTRALLLAGPALASLVLGGCASLGAHSPKKAPCTFASGTGLSLAVVRTGGDPCGPEIPLRPEWDVLQTHAYHQTGERKPQDATQGSDHV